MDSGLSGRLDNHECPWIMSTVPWTLSSETMDIVHCTIDFVGVCPGTQWTKSMDIVQSARTPWTLSTESMDIVLTVH